MRHLLKAGAAACLLAASACTTYTQTSSGADYIKRAEAAGAPLSEELKNAAAVEPIIEFPARIGIARIENGQLTDIPDEEWEAISTKLAGVDGKNEIVPISLFVLDLAAPESAPVAGRIDRGAARRNIVERLRFGGARQHADAIIIYEVFGKTDLRATSFSIADLTIIGAYIAPTHKANAVAHASALMFDVRNGYPYGGADATVEKEKLAAVFKSGAAKADLLKESEAAAVDDLAPKLADMLSQIEAQMAARKKA